ncbi:MAG: hypothetical protein ACSHWW_07390 [Nonlabens sp.]|uniref:hypothetical protein n=1 Tax=Nonlabens sp. TaxID=1888209 RepID=UPI003EF25AC9
MKLKLSLLSLLLILIVSCKEKEENKLDESTTQELIEPAETQKKIAEIVFKTIDLDQEDDLLKYDIDRNIKVSFMWSGANRNISKTATIYVKSESEIIPTGIMFCKDDNSFTYLYEKGTPTKESYEFNFEENFFITKNGMTHDVHSFDITEVKPIDIMGCEIGHTDPSGQENHSHKPTENHPRISSDKDSRNSHYPLSTGSILKGGKP